MRLKYYLRGLGLGIIFTCLMFMLFLNKTADNTDQLDVKRQIETATETMSDETDSDGSNNTADDLTVSDGAEAQTDATGDDLTESDGAEAQTDTTDDSSAADDVQDEYVTLVIEQGDIARDVAESLYEDGIIDDVESFRKYLGETGVSKTLHAGEYNIKVGSTYEEIVELLK